MGFSYIWDSHIYGIFRYGILRYGILRYGILDPTAVRAASAANAGKAGVKVDSSLSQPSS